jgi:prepilin-type N-terminal cleavage/methylation domain-containing protein
MVLRSWLDGRQCISGEDVVKNNRGFTLIELVVVVFLMGILAATTVFYGRKWYQQYKIGNTYQAVQGAVKVSRMNAVSVGTLGLLVFTDAYVTSSIHNANVDTSVSMLTYKLSASWSKFSGDFQLAGPWLWWSSNTTSPRVMYFSYNSKLYTFTPVATTITFNAKGLPIVAQNQQIVLTSPKTHRTFLLNISPLGKVE